MENKRKLSHSFSVLLAAALVTIWSFKVSAITCAKVFAGIEPVAARPFSSEHLELGNSQLSRRNGSCYDGCWIDSNLNRMEILVHDRTGQRIQLSSAYLVMNDLLMQANRIAGLQDPKSTKFLSVGRFIDFSELVEQVGLIPEEVMPHRSTIHRWDSLVDNLNRLSSDFSASLESITKQYPLQTRFGLLPMLMSKKARKEIKRLRIDFMNSVNNNISEVFGQPPTGFDFDNKHWSAVEFAEYVTAKARSTTRLIIVRRNPKNENGIASSNRYRDNRVALPYLSSGNIEKIEQVIISFLKSGEPVPAAFYMAYNHLNQNTITYSFRGPADPIQKSIFDIIHAMTIVGYETDAAENISKWVISNNSDSKNRYYYLDKIAFQKLLMWASFPLSDRNLDFIRLQLTP